MNYLLTAKDAHGQPRRLFKANLENNISKAIDQLSGICAGILADGEVCDAEATFFAQWVRKYAPYEPVWPFTEILQRVERIFTDGEIDDDERAELKVVMEALCGYTETAKPEETYAMALPLDSPQPDPVSFSNRSFVVTGRFAYGTRAKVVDAVSALGGVASDGFPNRESHYLVIGTFASRDWYATNYGRKIEKAVELRASGTGIAIISEEHWKRFIL
jgi:NAD-dependent DNA ligase